MPKELYIIVTQYPYAFGEPFLEEEVKVLEHRFDKIYFIIPEPKNVDKNAPQYYVPANGEVVFLKAGMSAWVKVLGVIGALFSLSFWEEVLLLKRKYNLPRNWTMLKHIFSYYGKAYKFIDEMKPIFSRSEADKIVYTYWCTEYTLAAAMLRDLNDTLKVVTRLHGWDINFERSNVKYLPMRTKIFNRLDTIYTISEHGKKYLNRKFPEINSTKIVNQYLGTQNGTYLPTPMKNEPFRLLSLAFISPVKQLHKITEALALIDDREIEWTHIGNGPLEAQIMAEAREKLGAKSNIKFSFLGAKSKSEIYALLGSSSFHCLINTSESEGIPVSLMEGLSFGIPVIAPAIGGIGEMVTTGYNGILMSTAPPVTEIRDAIMSIASMSEAAYQTMRTNAYQVWEGKFNASKNFSAFGDYLLEKSREFKECTKCILNTQDYPDIKFDEQGVCDICHTYEDLASRTILRGEAGNKALTDLIAEIKEYGKGKEYDCLIGVSGGVDSSYLAYLTREWGLRPLVIHVDNGWNTELAVSNIEKLLNTLNYDLYTYVIDWEEMRDLQLSFMKANVLDIDLPFDNAFMAILYRLAAKHNIKHILSGHNTATEGYLPPNFTHNKLDSINIRDIHKKFGTVKLKTFPVIGRLQQQYYEKVRQINIYTPLNWMEYNKADAKKLIIDKMQWRDYGGKHYENIFTRFYQGHILYKKFHVDKRKSHLSTLICSGQITKAEAEAEIQKPVYPDNSLLQLDTEFFLKKMNMSPAEFDRYIHAAPIPHTHYRSYENIINNIRPYYRMIKSITR
jgi:N-acetyl sugar amidotransferase